MYVKIMPKSTKIAATEQSTTHITTPVPPTFLPSRLKDNSLQPPVMHLCPKSSNTDVLTIDPGED
jgi:hypothetical protein